MNTIDDGVPPALAIGDSRYLIKSCPRCLPEPVYTGLQVNVFDRASLETVDEQGFDTTSSGISALGSYLKGLNTKLVFVTHPSSQSGIDYSELAALNTALGYIGGSYPGYWQLDQTCWAGQTDVCANNSVDQDRLGRPRDGGHRLVQHRRRPGDVGRAGMAGDSGPEPDGRRAHHRVPHKGRPGADRRHQ